MVSTKPTTSQLAKKVCTRSRTIKQINEELRSSEVLVIDEILYDELKAYLDSPPLLPKYISGERKKDVRAAQAALQELDGYQHRVAAVQFSVAKVLQALSRLETIVRGVLLKRDFILQSMTKHASQDRIALVCPLLPRVRAEWEGLDKLCTIVHNRISDSKDSLKQQIKLDDNARWANKISP